jgi:hypothetical protein
VWAGLRRGNARPGADGVVTDGAALSCSGRHTEPGLLRRLPGITALSAPPELLSVIARSILSTTSGTGLDRAILGSRRYWPGSLYDHRVSGKIG